MGAALCGLCGRKGARRRVLWVGLDGCGKTTALYHLVLGKAVDTIPTIGFNTEKVKCGGDTLAVWDVGGEPSIRPLWRQYFNGVDGIVFMVDANDRDRFAEARRELHHMMTSPSLVSTPVLIFANKLDLPQAAPPAEVAREMKVDSLEQSWFLQGCCGMTGDGLQEGMDWLATAFAAAEDEAQA